MLFNETILKFCIIQSFYFRYLDNRILTIRHQLSTLSILPSKHATSASTLKHTRAFHAWDGSWWANQLVSDIFPNIFWHYIIQLTYFPCKYVCQVVQLLDLLMLLIKIIDIMFNVLDILTNTCIYFVTHLWPLSHVSDKTWLLIDTYFQCETICWHAIS